MLKTVIEIAQTNQFILGNPIKYVEQEKKSYKISASDDTQTKDAGDLLYELDRMEED